MILTPLQKLTKNGEDWGKLIVAKGFEKLPKVQNIAKSGHTARMLHLLRTVMSSPDQECLVPLATPADETGTILTKLRPD